MKKEPVHIPFSAYYHHHRFYNYLPEFKLEHAESLVPSVKMYLGSLHNFMRKPCELVQWIMEHDIPKAAEQPVITWLGHASMLIQMAGKSILADPIFKTPSFLYRRILPFGIPMPHLPIIDVVLISHNHRDHMDEGSLLYLAKTFNPVFLVPQGNKAWFISRGISRVEEFYWWQQYQHEGMTFSFVPAWHWSQRGLFDHNKSLWGGWVIEGAGKKVYFAGDTAYNKYYFTTIAAQFPDLDIALLPIAPGDPDIWMRRSHINAQQAGQVFLDIGARHFIPMHWGTFYFGHDAFHTPIERLKAWWLAHLASSDNHFLHLLKLGQSFHLESKNSCSNMHDLNHHK